MEFSNSGTEYEGRFRNRGFLGSLGWLRFWQIRYEKVTLALVLGGKTKAPISLADFEAYMLYLANSIQDLQFIVWFHDYSARYFALPIKDQHQRCTRPRPTGSHDSLRPVADTAPDANSTPVAAQGDTGNRLDEKAAGSNLQGHSPAVSSDASMTVSPPTSPSLQLPQIPQSSRSSHNLLRLATLPQPESTRPPCSAGCSCRLPYQDECLRVMQTFFQPNQNKVLNVDKDLVDEIASLLPQTTHPAVFAKVYAQMYSRVEEVHLHRFLTIASINVNRHDKVTIHMMGIGSLLVALAIAFSTILALPHKNPALRAWRTFAVPFFWFAVMLCYSAVRGVCPAKFQTKATALHPWELSDIENGGNPVVRIGCSPGTVCVVPPPTTEPPVAHTRSTPYGNHTPKSSASSLSSTATPGGKANDLSHSFVPSTGPSDKPAGGTQDIQSQWYDSAVDVVHPPAPRPLPQFSESDLGSGIRWEFGEWNSSRGNVRNGYRKNPVWGPHKIVRDRRIRAVQLSVVLESLGISILCTLVFSAALYAVPSLH